MKKNQTQIMNFLSDQEIIELYWARNERAITETDAKYKRYLFTIAYNILHDRLDCEECINDTYLGTWNTIPPEKPSVFQAFISKIMRNIAVNRYKKNKADKRVPSEMTLSISEIENVFPDPSTTEEAYMISQISHIISEYLRGLSDKNAFIFISRYYCSDKIADIAKMLHTSESTVFRELTKMKNSLKEILIKEGYDYEG